MATRHHQVTCDVRFVRTEMNKSVTATPNIWRNAEITLPRFTKLETFDRKMKALVVDRLRRDVALLRRTRRRKAVITYETDILVEFCGKEWLTPKADDEHRFETLADLFTNPDAGDLKLEVDLNLGIVERPEDEPKQPLFDLNRELKQREVLDAPELVVELHSLEADRWEYEYLRIGYFELGGTKPPPGHKSTRYIPNSNDSISDIASHDCWLREHLVVHCPRIIVAYWHRGYGAYAADFTLMVVQGWNFGDYFIGEKLQSYEEYEYDPTDVDAIYLEPFALAEDKDELHKMVKEYLRDKPSPPEPIPFMPSFTLNTYSAKRLGLGVADETVDIVVRYVSHLENVPYSGRDPLWLPYNVQWTVKSRANSRAVNAAPMSTLVRHSGNQHLGVEEIQAIRSLFQNSLDGTWQLQLWVLPQAAQGSDGKMYRYPGTGSSRNRGLGHFLNQARVNGGGDTANAIYMEAHIVNKAENYGAVGMDVGEEESEDEEAEEEEAGEEEIGLDEERNELEESEHQMDGGEDGPNADVKEDEERDERELSQDPMDESEELPDADDEEEEDEAQEESNRPRQIFTSLGRTILRW